MDLSVQNFTPFNSPVKMKSQALTNACFVWTKRTLKIRCHKVVHQKILVWSVTKNIWITSKITFKRSIFFQLKTTSSFSRFTKKHSHILHKFKILFTTSFKGMKSTCFSTAVTFSVARQKSSQRNELCRGSGTNNYRRKSSFFVKLIPLRFYSQVRDLSTSWNSIQTLQVLLKYLSLFRGFISQ